MAVNYKDYYKTLGVSRSASQDEIKKSFRKLARENHPDRNKGDKGAEERFKEISEAYEVLGDEEKRKKYDMLGSNWKHGQKFTPPPGWESVFGGAGGGGGFNFNTGGGVDISDFFSFFQGAGGGAPGANGGRSRSGGGGFQDIFNFGGRGRGRVDPADLDVQREMTISLEDALHGGIKKVAMPGSRSFDVNIPPGIQDGKKIRLKGQGRVHGETAGDLFITVRIAPHPVYTLEGNDLVADLKVSPWEAALGASVQAPTPDGELSLTVPPGVGSGAKLRVSGKGFPVKPGGERGDLFFRVKILVPKKLTDKEKDLFEKLAKASKFDPRA